MTDFWENHFNVFAGKGRVRYFLPAYERDVIRPHALGNFRDLLGAVAQEPGDAVLPRQLAERRRPTQRRSPPSPEPRAARRLAATRRRAPRSSRAARAA